MSFFIEKLTRLRQTDTRPMGFAVSQTPSVKRRMLLIASLKAASLDKISGSVNQVDAILTEIGNSDDAVDIEKACKIKEEIPNGVWLKVSDMDVIKKVTDATCDFIVFPATAPLISTQKDELGKILELDLSWSEGLIRTIDNLPIDAILMPVQNNAEHLTFDRLMLVQRLVYLVNKPILASISDNLSEAELQALWDTGVLGVVVEIIDENSEARLTDLRKAIDNLKPSASLKKSKISPLVPCFQPEASQPSEEEQDE
jgi:hypothetical protein